MSRFTTAVGLELLGVALFGALGAMARYGVGLWLGRLEGTRLPLPTIAVNLAGSFILGLLAALAVADIGLPRTLRVPVATGLLGSFTTFSTFSVETVRLLEQGDLRSASLNVAIQLGLGLLGAAAGIALGRAISQ